MMNKMRMHKKHRIQVTTKKLDDSSPEVIPNSEISKLCNFIVIFKNTFPLLLGKNIRFKFSLEFHRKMGNQISCISSTNR